MLLPRESVIGGPRTLHDRLCSFCPVVRLRRVEQYRGDVSQLLPGIPTTALLHLLMSAVTFDCR